MRLMRISRSVVAIAVAIVVVALGLGAAPTVHGLSFVVRAADLHGVLRRVADLSTDTVHESILTIPIAPGQSIRARVFRPRASGRAALVVSGLHPAGIDEPRLAGLAHQLSASGITVVTPDIPEL